MISRVLNTGLKHSKYVRNASTTARPLQREFTMDSRFDFYNRFYAAGKDSFVNTKSLKPSISRGIKPILKKETSKIKVHA